MSSPKVRVRFAPSPTGLMHLGNIRTALLNYLFAQQHKGTFILRIEDTDPQRNFDPGGKQIIQDLNWLNLTFDEGPGKNELYPPYLQSERINLYQEKLEKLKQDGHIYRCFCTFEELEKKRARAIALKIPPRYDQICLKLSTDEINQKIAAGIPFIWRFQIPKEKKVTITDLARGEITFELDHFSDFPLSRSDGTFTFLFANLVDDLMMQMTHVLRGEDHLSNTANQALVTEALGGKSPIFWHLPILCNVEGKKLSKRDFGFSLNDLKTEGFLPEAINNYLAIIGGSYTQEIMSLKELAQAMHFDNIHAAGSIKYDVEKLRWMNHKWISKISDDSLFERVMPYLQAAYPQEIHNADRATLMRLITSIKTELVTLNDSVPAVHFFFVEPTINQQMLEEHIPNNAHTKIIEILHENLALLNDPDAFVKKINEDAQANAIAKKLLFTTIRLVLTGTTKGPGIHDLIAILGIDKISARIKKNL